MSMVRVGVASEVVHACVRSCAWGLVAALALLGCDGREERQRAEARTFLALYEATDHRAPVPERERKIEQLAQLGLSDELVQKARDECVSAHRTLVAAERENERAASQLDRAIAASPGGAALAPEDTVRIGEGIKQAERSLSDARTRFERCEAQARSLSLRFGAR